MAAHSSGQYHLTSVAIDRELLDKLDARCREIRRSRSFVIRIALGQYLQRPADPALKRELALLLDEAPSPRRTGKAGAR